MAKAPAVSKKPSTPKSKFGAPLGEGGLRQSGGYVTEEYEVRLRGTKAAEKYREMVDSDAICGAIIFVIRQLIANAKWTLTASDETQEAQDAKEFIEQCMDDCEETWPEIIAEICTMFQYGYAPMEMTFKRRDGVNSKHDDGQIGWASISLRGQASIQRWDFDEENGDKLRGLWQTVRSGKTVYIPIEKVMLFRTSTEKGNPEGRSILRSAYRSWIFKKRIEEIEGVGVERDMAGLPIARIPGYMMASSASAEDRAITASWKSLVTNIKRDKNEGIVLPSDRDSSGNLLFDLELLATGGSRTYDTTKIVDRWDRRIATSVLADFLFLGQQSVGSFALSSDKTALFAAAIGGFMRAITDIFNRRLIPLTWKVNAFPEEIMPKMTHGDIENPDLALLGGFLTALSGAGAPLFPDRNLENHLREVAGLPEAPEEGEDERIVPGEAEAAAVEASAEATRLGSEMLQSGLDPKTGKPPGEEDAANDDDAPPEKKKAVGKAKGRSELVDSQLFHDDKGNLVRSITKKMVPEGYRLAVVAKTFKYDADGLLQQIIEEPLEVE